MNNKFDSSGFFSDTAEEFLYNYNSKSEFKERIEKLELYQETLIKINEQYATTIGILRARLKDLIIKI